MLLTGSTKMFYRFDYETRIYGGSDEVIAGDIPGSYISPPYCCFDAPPENIPEDKVAWRNLENTAWLLVDKPADPTPEQLRQAAYVVELDPIQDQIDHYKAEAEMLRAVKGASSATVVEEKIEQLYSQALAIKEDIRARYPDPGPDQYCLNSTGTYHMQDCASASGSGTLLTMDEIAASNPEAKPCSRCNPPALPVEDVHE